MERWFKKTAVVTGASSGIGAAVAVKLADAGLNVVGLARRPALVDALVSKSRGTGTITSRECNISNTRINDIEETFEWIEKEFGGVDILVNNAGVFYQGHISDESLSDEEIVSCLDINLKGLILCTRRALVSMKKRKVDGHIVNVSSIAGQYIPFASFFNVYPCSKHGVTAFTSTLANELAQIGSNIKTTNISPGLVDTPMSVNDAEVPSLRPEDVADSILYVISTPPSVNISELTIQPVSEKRL